MLQGTKLAGNWWVITEPVVPASSHLPYTCLNAVCRHLQANLGADCSTEGAQESRGAEAALGRQQGSRLPGLGSSPCPSTPTPWGCWVPQGAAAEWSQPLPCQAAVLIASEEGKESGNESSQAVLSHISAALVSDRHWRQPQPCLSDGMVGVWKAIAVSTAGRQG